jgi:hypothetical protein
VAEAAAVGAGNAAGGEADAASTGDHA